jgi:hypothetical protein
MMTTIISGAPMYLDTIGLLGLRSTLNTLSESNRNVLVFADRFPLTTSSISAATEQVDIALEEFGDLVVSVSQESHTSPHFWALDAESIIVGPASDTGILQRFEGFPEYVEFIDGRAPNGRVEQELGVLSAEVAVPFDRSELLGVNLDDDIWLAASPSDPPYLKLRVVGRFRPHDLQEEFWFGLGHEATEPPAPSLVARHPLPLFVGADDSLFGLLTGGPASIGTNRWLVRLDLAHLKDQDPAVTEDQIAAVAGRLRLGLPESKLVSAIENRFRALREDITFARIPTLMMGGVVLVAAAFYAITAAGALMTRRRVDTGRLRARGFARNQIAKIYFLETVPFVLIPTLLAPFLALGIISLMGQLPEYEMITFDGEGMPVRLTWQTFALSLLGGGVVLAYMQWIVCVGDGREIDSARLSSKRVEGRPFFQRQYLDVIFLLFGGVVLWDLSTEASVVSERTGQLADISKLLVFAPAIFLGVVVLFSLRLMPLIARGVSNVMSKRGPAWIHIVSATMARLPITYAWPIAILGTVAGAAVLSSTVAATLEQSANDQSGYEVGAGLRASPVDLNSGARTAVVSAVREIEGVAGVSIGLRAIGGLRDGGQGLPFDFIAIEPEEFAEFGNFRDDYSGVPLDELLVGLEPKTNDRFQPIAVPREAVSVGVIMKSSVSHQSVTASMRLLDAKGRAWSVDLGPMTGVDWQERLGDIPGSAVRPVEIVGFVFFEQANDELGTPMRVHIDDIFYSKQPFDSHDEVRERWIIETFESGEFWEPLGSSKGMDTTSTSFDYSSGSRGNGSPGLEIDLGVGTNRGYRGAVRVPESLVPVLFSTEALALNGLSVGDETVVNVFEQSVPVRVVGVVDYFPTMDPREGGFVVADANLLWSYLSMSSFNSAGFLAEMFIGLDDVSDTAVLNEISSEIGGIHRLLDSEKLRESSLVTPLAIVGWRGVSVVTSILAVVLGLLGFLTFAPSRPSSARFDVAILSALGMSRLVLTVVSVVEQLVVVAVGMGMGLATGLLMARLAVDATTQTVSSGTVLPRIVFSTNWSYVGILLGVLGAALIVITVRDVIAIRRADLAVAMKGDG